MMKNLLYTLALILVANFGFSQIDITPGELSLVADGTGDQIYQEFHLVNNSGTDMNLYWSLDLDENFPEEWTAQICDINLCYGWGTYSINPAAPNAFPDGADLKFSIKARRNDFGIMEQTASYAVIRLFDDADLTNEVGSSNIPTVSTVDIDLKDVVIYPNPTTDAFQIKNDDDISAVNVYNIVGRQVDRLKHTPGMIHNVSTLRTGMYLIRLEDSNGNVLKAMRLSKR